MPASIEAARAGVTTGEWSDALREIFGEFRAPTGVSQAAQARDGYAELNEVRERVARVAKALGVKRLRMLVGKPGLDGHSNGAEQIAVRARDAGYEVVYQGIRLTPEMIAQAAVDEDVHVIGLSILSGGHVLLVPDVIARLKDRGVDPSEVPVVVGGIIPEDDARALESAGVAKVYTPKDFDLTRIVGEIAAYAVSVDDGSLASDGNRGLEPREQRPRWHHHEALRCGCGDRSREALRQPGRDRGDG